MERGEHRLHDRKQAVAKNSHRILGVPYIMANPIFALRELPLA